MIGFCKQGFLTLTNKIITVVGAEGWRGLSIQCASDSAADIVVSSDLTGGNATIGGQALTTIAIKKGESITVGVSSDKDVDGVIIDTTAGGTAKIVGSRFETTN